MFCVVAALTVGISTSSAEPSPPLAIGGNEYVGESSERDDGLQGESLLMGIALVVYIIGPGAFGLHFLGRQDFENNPQYLVIGVAGVAWSVRKMVQIKNMPMGM